jgi:hypothetical protein
MSITKAVGPESTDQTFTRWLSDGSTWIGVFENQDLGHPDVGRRIALPYDDALFEQATVGKSDGARPRGDRSRLALHPAREGARRRRSHGVDRAQGPAMKLKLRKDAYAPGALVEAGVPGHLVAKLVADDPQGRLERPRLALSGRRRGEPTSAYVWGPDALALLSEPAQAVTGGLL